MMTETAKTTAPFPSVGADGEQPDSQKTTISIADNLSGNKPQEQNLEEMLRQIQQMNDPAYLHSLSMRELFDTVYQSKPPILDGLLYIGTYLFAGVPKVGKSFLMVQLAYHVSIGTPLWGHPVHKETVLYLALEDTYGRVQRRLHQMYDINITDNLRVAAYVKQLGTGLDEQLQKFVKEYPDTRLIIIDTLRGIRETESKKCSYANNYEVITQLNQFADRHNVCLLLVHHTRKQQPDDKFDMISGTSGLLGVADRAFLLHKEKRTDNTVILAVSG